MATEVFQFPAVHSPVARGEGGELSREWSAEVERRIDAVERGESRLIPGAEVEADILETLRGL